MNLARYRKAIVAVIAALAEVGLAVWGPGNPWVATGIAVATALGVYGVPNQPKTGA